MSRTADLNGLGTRLVRRLPVREEHGERHRRRQLPAAMPAATRRLGVTVQGQVRHHRVVATDNEPDE